MLTKYSLHLFGALTLALSVALADTGHAQIKSVKEVYVKIDQSNPTIQGVFDEIEKKTYYSFFYSGSAVNTSHRLALKSSEQTVEEVLLEIARQANLQFRQVNRNISVKQVEASTVRKEIEVIISPEITVTGKVKDDAGTELPGAAVTVKGSSVGTVTDLDGNYSIQVPESGEVLVFSFLGYVSEEVPIRGQTEINVTLMPDIKNLDEIVVVGYGEQKRSNLTGSISSVKMEDLQNRPIVRIDQALQGMSSGVFVSKGGGAPGASPTIHIRGVGSIGNTDPLWIVDGIPMGTGNHFNLDDIESIEILKDAASSAIYGAGAAHGVILVTTKRGKGNLQMTYKSSFGKQIPLNLPELLGSQEFVDYKKQSRLNAGQNPEPSWDNWTHDTDWIGAFYAGSGFSQYHDFSISQGTDRFNYYLSLGYDDEEGILIDNRFQRYSLRFNSDAQLTKWLKIGESILLSKVDENPIDNFDENYSGAIPYRSIPIMPIRDENNAFGGWGMAPVYFQGPNPVATQYQQHRYDAYSRLDGNLYALLTPVEGLSVRGNMGYNYASYLGRAFHESFNYGAFANPINSLTYSHGMDRTLTLNGVATYEKKLGKHYLKAMAGTEALRYDGTHFNITGTNFPVQVAWSFNLATGAITTTDRFNISAPRRLFSQFGRFNYNFADKYLFEANIRRDASGDKFGPSNRWGVFPSFSAGWRIAQESFLQNVSFLSDLKLRGSTGRLGSSNIAPFLFLRTYTSQFSTYAYDANGNNKESGFFISKFPNEDVKWEEVNMHNLGLDVSVLDGKLSLNVDYYIKDTRDLLYSVPIPPSNGIAVHNHASVNPEMNVGTMRNTGVDLDLTYRSVWRQWNFSVRGNTSFMKNELTKLNGDEYIVGGSAGGQMGGMTRTQAGMPVSSFFGYSVQQMLNTSSDVYAINTWADDGYYQEAGTGPGDFMYLDIGGPDGVPDGQITAEHDRMFIGNPWPKMMYGLNINASFNQLLDFIIQFQGVQGVDIFNASKAYSRNFFGDNNTTTLIREAWTPENWTQHPRNIASDPNGNFSRPSTYFVEDGSYLKLRNVQVGFNVPQRVSQNWKMSKVRLYVNANNLLTFTRYSGMDPEIAGSNTSRGIDYGLYPHVRSFTGGVEVQF